MPSRAWEQVKKVWPGVQRHGNTLHVRHGNRETKGWPRFRSHGNGLHVRYVNGLQRCGHALKGVGICYEGVAMHSKAWDNLTCKV